QAVRIGGISKDLFSIGGEEPVLFVRSFFTYFGFMYQLLVCKPAPELQDGNSAVAHQLHQLRNCFRLLSAAADRLKHRSEPGRGLQDRGGVGDLVVCVRPGVADRRHHVSQPDRSRSFLPAGPESSCAQGSNRPEGPKRSLQTLTPISAAKAQ